MHMNKKNLFIEFNIKDSIEYNIIFIEFNIAPVIQTKI